jgi:thioredoxin reductase (NADPH)
MRTSSSSEVEVPEAPETPDVSGAYPRLTDDQIMLLSGYGQREQVPRYGVLFCEGDTDCDFYVVLAGKVSVVQETDSKPQLIAVHGPGRFLGDMSLLTGQAIYTTAVAQQDTEVLAVPMDRLHQVVADNPSLGDLILRAFLIRRSLHFGIGAGFRIIGSRYSADTRRLRDFAARNRIPHRWIDLEEDRGAEQILRRLGIRPEETPVVVWKGHQVLRNPSNAELAEIIGLRVHTPDRGAHDLVVVGAGPAGLAAAVYGASEGLTTIVLDAVATGGQAATSSLIENYLGFPAGISGAELADRAVVQARKFGATFTIPGEAKGLRLADDGYHEVVLEDGQELVTSTVIIATGAHYRRLEAKGLDRLEATSVYYAATEAEARLCRGDPVTVVGGGNSAGQAALFLSRQSSQVNLVILHDDLYRDMSRYLADRILRTDKVRLWPHSEVCELLGDSALRAVLIRDVNTDERHELDSTALFVLIGATPQTAWLEGQVPLDEDGFIVTGYTGEAHAGNGCPGMFETARPGILAVGDVRSGSVKRVASAVGEGAVAVRLVHDHLMHGSRR